MEPLRWYGVWLFVDWLEFSGAELDPSDTQQVAATAAVELEASRRDPYRQLSRVFHLVGRKSASIDARKGLCTLLNEIQAVDVQSWHLTRV